MSKNKLARFAENKTFSTLFQHSDYGVNEPFPLKGKWCVDYFKNDNPVVLELGCGRGEYSVEMAMRFSDKNFIGVDRKGARLWRGAKTAFEENMTNLAFLRIGIDKIENYFAENEVSEIWIPFPDPQPCKERRRLTSPTFAKKYLQIIKPGATINLKTDSRMLYEYTKEMIIQEKWTLLEDIFDVYSSEESSLLTSIQTHYEQIWLKEGKIISFLKYLL